MASMAQAQRDGFDSRISRIRTGKSDNVLGRLEVGPRDEVRAYEEGRKGKRARRKVVIRDVQGGGDSLGSLLLIAPLAMAIGALCFVSGRIAAFHLFTGQGLYAVDLPDWVWRIDLWGDVAIAGGLALFLGWTLRLGHGARRTALLLGFAGMMSAEVLVMQEFPEVFERFYTPAYVTAATAEPFYLF